MLRIEAKVGRKWRLGINVYETLDEITKRKEEMEAVGCKVRIKKVNW